MTEEKLPDQNPPPLVKDYKPKREWQELTDDEIGVWPVWSPEIEEFVRTIEAKLKEKNT